MVSALSLIDNLKPAEIRQIPQDRRYFDEMAATISGGLRIYHTPEGWFPSVTSVLGASSDKQWLVEWRERVGDAKADEIVARSQQRGSRMHEALDRRFTNDPLWVDACEGDFEAEIMARCIVEDVIDMVDSVITSESPLYSADLRVAGRVDNVSVIKGKPAILDFKNARRIKTAEDIPDYFLQTALYSKMLREMTGIEADDMYVAMAFAESHLGQSTLFHENYYDWIQQAENTVYEFHRKHESPENV